MNSKMLVESNEKPDGTLKRFLATVVTSILLNCASSNIALADNAAEMAKKIQDPLADLAALQVDFKAKFNVGENKNTSYSAIFQPLYTIDTENYNLVTRQLIPVLYVPEVTNGNTKYSWKLGDIVSSAFISPKTDSDWKWGIGPQVSLKTRTNDQLAGGAGWGWGITSVATGASGPWAFATFLSHLWDVDGKYSTTTFQPLVFFNIDSMPGVMLSYQGEITYDWKAGDEEALRLPLGLQIGKMFDLGNGWGFQFDFGGYIAPKSSADKPTDWELKATAFLVIPTLP